MSKYRDRITEAGERYATDRDRLERSRDDLADVIRLAILQGMSESEAARLAGVTRMTIRAWLGKR